jgi:hypothetical protein
MRKSIHICREAKMKEPNKKFWREKVTAEITLTHLRKIAQEAGVSLAPEDTATFLNSGSFAQTLWVRMMRAGEEYIKSSLYVSPHNIRDAKGLAPQATIAR